MKKILQLVGVCLVVIMCLVIIKTSVYKSKQFINVNKPNTINLNTDSIAIHLAKAVKYKTISSPDTSKFDNEEFQGLLSYFEKTFPKVHSLLSKEVVGKYSLLFTWKGEIDSLKPLLLMSHFDVVGVEQDTEQNWEYAPFEGTIADGYIWGRGTLDDKEGVVGILEAVEYLLGTDFKPQRTIYFAFGHDEEVGGLNGASKIADLLQSRNVSLESVLDEGGIVVDGMLPGISAPTALVGIAEKGYLSVELTATSIGGHSSAPSKHTAVGMLCSAIHKLESNSLPASLDGATQIMLDYIGPEMNYLPRMMFANLWLTKGLLKNQFEKSSFTNAMLRTTTAATIIAGGEEENVLPTQAKAIVNFRLLPGDSIQHIINHVQKTINDSGISIIAKSMGILGGNEPSLISDVSSPNFSKLQTTIHQMFPDAIVAPWQLIGATDSKFYNNMCDNIYRFTPVRTTNDDMGGYHGANERISVKSYEDCVKFYVQFIYNSNNYP